MYRRMEFLKGEFKYPNLKICSENNREANIPRAQYARGKVLGDGAKSGGRRRLYGATKALVRTLYLVLHVTGSLERVINRE